MKENRLINRIIDANINRTKEGLRVCEEVVRFILEDSRLTYDFKRARHKIADLSKRFLPSAKIIKERDSTKDIGRDIHVDELKRKNWQDIFFANIQRVKESIRVLEEFSKLKDTRIALDFKRMRYNIYEFEKRAIKKISSLCNYRQKDL
ncbi:MAG: thiamine-phosphate pyrophosphorylase [Candidatus Omnitrophica bacterium]|nr:thiamine-phosphate pyrophosphorylase [Candidatus Omnitrophota bacterium]